MNSVSGAISRIFAIVAADRAVRIDPEVVGRHQPAGGVLVVRDELAQIVGRLARPSRAAALPAGLPGRSPSRSAASSESISSMMSAARSVPRSSMIERWTSASRCSSASAARSSSSEPTTRAASCADSSPMMSASSRGMQAREPVLADREPDLRRVEVVQRRDVVPRDQRARHAVEQPRRRAAPRRAGAAARRRRCRRRRRAARRRCAATSMSLMRTTLRPSTSTICLSNRSSTR